MQLDKQNKKRMSPKIFARPRYTGEKAKTYIANNMDYLKSHSFLEPILTAYEVQEIDDTSALYALQQALLSYQVSCNLAQAEKQLEASAVVKSDKPSDQYSITIYCNVSGGIDVGKRIIKRRHMDEQTGKLIMWDEEEDMIYGRAKFQEAQQKAYRALVGAEDSVFAEIVNNYGAPIKTLIYRNDAFAALFVKTRQPFMKNLGKHNAPLKNYCKSKNDRSIGPWSINK